MQHIKVMQIDFANSKVGYINNTWKVKLGIKIMI